MADGDIHFVILGKTFELFRTQSLGRVTYSETLMLSFGGDNVGLLLLAIVYCTESLTSWLFLLTLVEQETEFVLGRQLLQFFHQFFLGHIFRFTISANWFQSSKSSV